MACINRDGVSVGIEDLEDVMPVIHLVFDWLWRQSPFSKAVPILLKIFARAPANHQFEVFFPIRRFRPNP